MPAVLLTGPILLCRTRHFFLNGGRSHHQYSFFLPTEDGQVELFRVALSNVKMVYLRSVTHLSFTVTLLVLYLRLILGSIFIAAILKLLIYITLVLLG